MPKQIFHKAVVKKSWNSVLINLQMASTQVLLKKLKDFEIKHTMESLNTSIFMCSLQQEV